MNKTGIPFLGLTSILPYFFIVSLLSDEHIPLNPEDSDPHETDVESSKTPSTCRFQVMQKQGTSDFELLNQAIAIAAEQRLGLSDANDVAHSSQVSSPTVPPFR